MNLNLLKHRAIQIGITNEAVDLYVNHWLKQISNVTELTIEIKS
ncbi:DUF4291 family protein [Pseudoalteromonas luteoviolacea]